MKFAFYLIIMISISACSSVQKNDGAIKENISIDENEIIHSNISLNKKLINNKNFTKALEHAQKLIVSNPEDYLGYYLAGITYMEKGDNNSALSSLQRAEDEIMTDKADRIIINDIRKRIAILFYMNSDFNNSEKYFNLCWEEIDKDGELYYKRGYVQLKLDLKKKGFYNLEKSSENGHEKALILFNTIINDHKEKVIILYAQCLSGSSEGCVNLFKILSVDDTLNIESGVGNISKVEALTEAASMGNSDAEKIFSTEVLKKCDKLFSTETCFPVSVYYFKTQKYDKALYYMNKISENEPDNPFWHYSLALFYAYSGDYKLSAEKLKRAIDIDITYGETSLKEPILTKTVEIIRSEH